MATMALFALRNRTFLRWGRDHGFMTSGTPPKGGRQIERKTRLAEELRANLQKRKAQSRSRRIGHADSRPEGIAASKTNSND